MNVRVFLAPLFAMALLGATTPEARFAVTLPSDLAGDAGGRLLVFAAPATPASASADVVDVESEGVSIAARDVTGFGSGHTVAIDVQKAAFPKGFTTLAPGAYRVQVVLDRDGSYNYSGRGPGDLVSKVATIRFPLSSMPTISLDHAVPAEGTQFDVTGLPPKAAEQITASRPHLHDEYIASRVLTRFRGSRQSIAAWVLTPPGYDAAARTTYPTVYTTGGFGATHKFDGQRLSTQWHLMETGAIPPMIWVALDYATPTGTTEFADSVNNGPWGQASRTSSPHWRAAIAWTRGPPVVS